VVEYPSFEEERNIVKMMGLEEKSHGIDIVGEVITGSEVVELRDLSRNIYVDDKVVEYILRLVDATRNPAKYDLDLTSYIRYGASPRASIYLARAARSRAMIEGREFVKPDDIKAILHDILRHRVIPSYEAEADEITSDDIIQKIMDGVPVP